jgi:hypothetical protein
MEQSKQGPNPDAQRRFVRAFAWALGGALALLGAFNVGVNPYGYYPTRIVRPLTWSSRVTHSDDLAQCHQWQAVVLGSSRSMKLSPSQIEQKSGLRTYNAAVDSAMAEDLLAIWRLAHERCGATLRELIIGIDIESFHDVQEPDGRITGAPLIWTHLPPQEQLRSASAALSRTLSWEQTAQSIRSLQLAATGYPADKVRFDADGYLHYLDHEQAKASGTFVLDSHATTQAYLQRFAGMRHVSERRRAVFETLLRETAQAGVRVRTFITPLHEDLVTALKKERDFDHLRTEVVTMISELQRQYPHFTNEDFTEVQSFSGSPQAFYDGAHIDDQNADRLIDTLYGKRADALQ